MIDGKGGNIANKPEAARGLSEPILINEVQLLLAEKRTYYAILRTGIAVFSLPLTIIGFLLATSQYHTIFETNWVGTTVVSFLVVISLFGLYISQRAEHKVARINQFIEQIRTENKRLAEIVI